MGAKEGIIHKTFIIAHAMHIGGYDPALVAKGVRLPDCDLEIMGFQKAVILSEVHVTARR